LIVIIHQVLVPVIIVIIMVPFIHCLGSSSLSPPHHRLALFIVDLPPFIVKSPHAFATTYHPVIIVVKGWGPVPLFLVLFSVLVVLLDPPCEQDNLKKNKMRMLVG